MKLKHIAALILASSTVVPALAETTLACYDAEGQSVKYVVTDDSQLKFNDEGVEIYDGEELLATVAYDKISYLKFECPTGIDDVESDGLLRLTQNPVGDRLAVVGHQGVATLAVTDTEGRIRIRINEWHGQPVDVTSLSAGLYILNIDKNTIKFIKK